MSLHGWISLLVTIAVFVVLQRRRNAPPDLLFLGALVFVTITGVIRPEQALRGFANPAVITVGALFVVATGLRTTGVLDWVGHRLLGTAQTEGSALRRLAVSALPASAFVNNTPVVVMMVPVVVDWCRRRSISPSRLLIPLSYLTILGGVCTLIGTSTTLIVNGLLINAYSDARNDASPGAAEFAAALRPMHMFEIGYVGLPCAIVGMCVLLLLARRFLPNRTELIQRLGKHRREYLVEMLVMPECRLIGQSVEAAGLRHLPGLFLIEIDRDGDTITPVTPEDIIHANDRLIFTGIVETIVDLEKIPGLVPAADMTYEFQPSQRSRRHLTEAVVSNASPLIGTTIREANFRQLYNAAVVAVHRNGARLPSKIGDVRMQAGDTLLLQTRTEFVDNFRNSRDFYLVSGVEGSQARRHDRAWLAAALMGLLVLWLSASSWIDRLGPWAGFSSPAIAAVAVGGLMVLTRCVPIGEARTAIDLRVLLTIAGALGLGTALDQSGAARTIAHVLVGEFGSGNPFLLMVLIYILAAVFTELVTNNAVAAMLFPLAVATAAASGYSPRPFVMAVALGASLPFLTPVGYATNLLVMGPGGYRPVDYLRMGLPMALAVGVVAIFLIPRVWPF